ncbi:DUF6728 family protein [Chitinophaga nivalis]|uniref:DUF5808 domain-containing protein n=1 Tax=Chitinophaga nivalis TaxID=2991709 RepID=A0ABT3ISY2_9BACT|nr:DUF6728 family protein [Chitinophaga nivalis]MCW3463222.1 hypothetical protein [Chitinophaga nivalis]MCW3487088.1 hypothetical protein [Chitinophaga nivalis]
MKSMWQQILRYFYIGKGDPNAPKTRYVAMMHGMNRLSLLLFIVALVIMIVRLWKRH